MCGLSHTADGCVLCMVQHLWLEDGGCEEWLPIWGLLGKARWRLQVISSTRLEKWRWPGSWGEGLCGCFFFEVLVLNVFLVVKGFFL